MASFIALNQLDDGRKIAAFVKNKKLDDLFIDPKPNTGALRPGAIFRGKADRPLKGAHGSFITLPNGQTGFLKQSHVKQGQNTLVMVTSFAEAGKAPPVTERILFKGRYAILTPDKPGINIARSITNEARRGALSKMAHSAMNSADKTLGLILRSAAEMSSDEAISDEIIALREKAETVLSARNGAPALLLPAPNAHELALQEWLEPDELYKDPHSFEQFDLWSQIEALKKPEVPLSTGAISYFETTRALTTIDVNTGGDNSTAAGLKANLACIKEIPRHLRLRGIGGQIIIDFAPMTRSDRARVETALSTALKADRVETALIGWTKMGLMELQRKRERQAIEELL